MPMTTYLCTKNGLMIGRAFTKLNADIGTMAEAPKPNNIAAEVHERMPVILESERL